MITTTKETLETLESEERKMELSNHYKRDRNYRQAIIDAIGEGTAVATIIIDKGHWHGPERHVLTNTGIILIFNNTTNVLVTKLIARPGQVRRFYENGNAPRYLLNLAYDHTQKGYNV